MHATSTLPSLKNRLFVFKMICTSLARMKLDEMEMDGCWICRAERGPCKTDGIRHSKQSMQ